MDTILIGAHIFVTIFLIIVILLQTGKGSDIGAVFGGGAQALFGGRGPATFLNKMTIFLSIIFFATSIGLAKIGQNAGSKSVLDKIDPTVLTQPALNQPAVNQPVINEVEKNQTPPAAVEVPVKK